jgi:hypothetical protein
MTIRYLVDTDWAIHYLNDHQGIVERLRNLLCVFSSSAPRLQLCRRMEQLIEEARTSGMVDRVIM